MRLPRERPSSCFPSWAAGTPDRYFSVRASRIQSRVGLANPSRDRSNALRIDPVRWPRGEEAHEGGEAKEVNPSDPDLPSRDGNEPEVVLRKLCGVGRRDEHRDGLGDGDVVQTFERIVDGWQEAQRDAEDLGDRVRTARVLRRRADREAHEDQPDP